MRHCGTGASPVVRLAVVFVIAVLSCRTSRGPAATDTPITPLTATSAEDALRELLARRAAFTGARTLVRVRYATPQQTQSFRAQLQIDARGHMRLTAYTPIGTTAATLSANGDDVTLTNHLDGTTWRGSARDLGTQYRLFAAGLTPADMAMLLLGLPPSSDAATYEPTATGLSRAVVGDVTVTYDPPSFPAKNVVVTRGDDRLEIEHLETYATTEPVTP